MFATHIAETSFTMDVIYSIMDPGFAKHPTKHKFQNLR
jgi:HrpA-like RNA helicase